jgi:hypothetical protein
MSSEPNTASPGGFASLSSSLLARKGQAKPAMRPQAIQVGQSYAQSLEDLGWNDMGHEQDAQAQSPADGRPTEALVSMPGVHEVSQEVPPAVHTHYEQLSREYEPAQDDDYSNICLTPSSEAMRAPRAAPGSKGKSAFTLRLDGERHLKLRLVCAVKHKSAQQMVTQALDEFLARQPEVADLPFRQRN